MHLFHISSGTWVTAVKADGTTEPKLTNKEAYFALEDLVGDPLGHVAPRTADYRFRLGRNGRGYTELRVMPVGVEVL